MLEMVLGLLAVVLTLVLAYVLKYKKVEQGFTAFNEFVDVVNVVRDALKDKQITKAELVEVLKQVEEFIAAVEAACKPNGE